MNELLKVILSLSLSGSLLILALFLCRPLFKKSLSFSWQYYVWLIVIARLLLPFTPQTSLVGALFQHGDRAAASMVSPAPTPDTPDTLAPALKVPEWKAKHPQDSLQNQPPAHPQEPPMIPRQSNQTQFVFLIQNLWLFWLGTALLLLIRKITIYQDFVRYIKAGHSEVSDIRLLNRLSEIEEQAGVKRPLELYTNDLISSPQLIGLFRPCIVLPTADLPDTDFQYTILHELTHYKRRDIFYKWLVQLVVCLHWFNPLVYLMGREISRTCELSCDEAVIRTLTPQNRRAYGDTLISAIGTGGRYQASLASVTLHESGERLKERLEAIMNYKIKSKPILFLTLVLTLITAGTATAFGAYGTPFNSAKGSAKDLSKAASVSRTAAVPAETDKEKQISGSILPADLEKLKLSLSIYNGGIIILPTDENKITASYDEQYYSVQMAEKDGRYSLSVSGKQAMMGKTHDLLLYLPNLPRDINVNVSSGDFTYQIPDDSSGSININVANGGVHFTSDQHYENSSIVLTAANKDFLTYEAPVYPDYFTKTVTGLQYENGTEANKIKVTLSGYSNVDFKD